MSEPIVKKAAWKSVNHDGQMPACKVYKGRALFLKLFGHEFIVLAQDIDALKHIADGLCMTDLDLEACKPAMVAPDHLP